MSDNDVLGQFEVLVSICCGSVWSDIWDALGLEVLHFESLNLAADASDAAIWQACQANDVVLVTGNRSANSSNSLEATIRDLGDERSLPVLTLADPVAVMCDRNYAERTVERLLDILVDLESYRGTGRLFLP